MRGSSPSARIGRAVPGRVESTLRVNVLGAFCDAQARCAAPARGRRRRAPLHRLAGRRARLPEMSAYCASKFALVGLVESLAAGARARRDPGLRCCPRRHGDGDVPRTRAGAGEALGCGRGPGRRADPAHRSRSTGPRRRKTSRTPSSTSPPRRPAYVSGVALVLDGGESSRMSGLLDGKIALITGAASGIGRSTALLFADEGATLVLADVDGRVGGRPSGSSRERGGTASSFAATLSAIRPGRGARPRSASSGSAGSTAPTTTRASAARARRLRTTTRRRGIA